MPITVKDGDGGPRQRNIASLVGGFVIAIGCFVLWMLVAGQIEGHRPGAIVTTLGLAVAVAIGVWIRLADL